MTAPRSRRPADRTRAALVALTPLLSVALLAGCGGSGSAAAPAGNSAAAGSGSGDRATEPAAQEKLGTVQTVACPGAAKALPVPGDFPVPLPQGVLVVDIRHADDGRSVVTGVVPTAERDVLADLRRAYAAAGLTLTEGETEDRDAESNFTGPGLTGRWGIRELADCSPAATRIDIVYRRT